VRWKLGSLVVGSSFSGRNLVFPWATSGRHVFRKRFTFFSGRVNVNREKPRFSRLTKANLKAFEDFAKAPGENLVFGGWLVLNNPLPPSPADFTFSRGAAPELRSRTLQKRLVKDCFQGAHGRKRGFSRTPSSGTELLTRGAASLQPGSFSRRGETSFWTATSEAFTGKNLVLAGKNLVFSSEERLLSKRSRSKTRFFPNAVVGT